MPNVSHIHNPFMLVMQGTTTGVSQREREMWRKHERAEKEGRAGEETEREEKKKELEPLKPIEMPKQAEKVSIKRDKKGTVPNSRMFSAKELNRIHVLIIRLKFFLYHHTYTI